MCIDYARDPAHVNPPSQLPAGAPSWKDDIVGSGNVVEDLGHPRPGEALAKAELAREIGHSS